MKKRKQQSNPNTIYKGLKTELNPTQKQIVVFKKSCGVARFAYNWALDFNQQEYERKQLDQQIHINERKALGLTNYSEDELKAWQKIQHSQYVYPSRDNLLKIFNSIKHIDFPWTKEVSKCCSDLALTGLDNAFSRFFKHTSKFPKFKKKGKCLDSFSVDCYIEIKEDRVRVPGVGWVKLKEHNYLPVGIPKKMTISRKADRWFVSIYQEVEAKRSEYNNETIGVDLGIKTLATCSNGTIIPACQKVKQKQKRLRRKQRKMARQKIGSNRRNKTKVEIAKIHMDIANHRKDVLHKATTYLAKTTLEGTVVIEDLNIKGMLKNHKLARAISNIGAYEFRRQLEYKCLWYGKKLVVANRWFPSSKMDYKTGVVNPDLRLEDRIIKHEDGTQTDRDKNASYNLRDYPSKHAFKYETKEVVKPSIPNEVQGMNTARYAGISVKPCVQLVGAGELSRRVRDEEVSLISNENLESGCSSEKRGKNVVIHNSEEYERDLLA